MSVSPGNGMPGDEVVLEVYGINTDTAGNHVTFTLASNVIVESMIYGAVVDGDNVRLTVAVPNGAAPANANASIAVKNTLGVKTNPAKFSYTPIPYPTITGLRSTDGIASPGRSLLIDGANFATGSKVFFTKIPGSSGPVPAVQSYAVYPTSTVLPAGIPNYTLASQGVAGVYVVSHYSHKYLQGDMQGPEFPVVLDATTPGAVGAILNTATLSTTSASPGFPMLVLGSGFTNVQGEVHCVLSATQDLSATILSWSDGAILVQCPDYQGIPAAVNGTVYVKGGNGSNSPPVPFTFAPQMEYQYIDLSKYKSDWAFYTYGAEDCWNMADNRCGAWHYDDSFWYGASGADAMFFKGNPGYRTDLGPQMLLKNNWTVCAVDWSQDEGNDSYQSVNFKAHLGSNNPYLEVDWSISAIIGGCTGYSFGIEIYGPKGCDYF
jgi:hypothetical protein